MMGRVPSRPSGSLGLCFSANSTLSTPRKKRKKKENPFNTSRNVQLLFLFLAATADVCGRVVGPLKKKKKKEF